MNLEVVILAAGKGTRMCSNIPKVLHKVGNKELLNHMIEKAENLFADKIHIVYGYKGELIKETIKGDYDWCYQEQQLGTADAVKVALPNCSKNSKILILVSDIPLIEEQTLKDLIYSFDNKGVGVLTSKVSNPFGLGRIIRNENNEIVSIVEEKDCTDEQKRITEINTGVIVSDYESLSLLLSKVENNNSQKEYYLTDIIKLANEYNINVYSSEALNFKECEGINNNYQLAVAERLYQEKIAKTYMMNGLTLLDYTRFDVRGSLEFGKDCVIDVNVVINGNVKLGDNVYIGPGSVLTDCEIQSGSVISPYTVIESSKVGENNTIGPFARLRPGCEFAEKVHVGNFVEVKKSQLNVGVKAGHLSYLGDSVIGKNVNIGAGTITCNYDGKNKHKTVICDDVFVGSDTQLVAPVTVNKGVTIGAGTTVTKDVQEGSLIITRVKPKIIENWKKYKD